MIVRGLCLVLLGVALGLAGAFWWESLLGGMAVSAATWAVACAVLLVGFCSVLMAMERS